MYIVKEICFAVCFFILSKACVVNYKIGKYLPGWRFKTTNDRSLYSCADSCMSYPICKSLNFDKKRRLCHLNTVRYTLYPDNLQSDENYWYSDITAWKDVTLGPCQRASCNITQRCVVNRTKTARCEDALVNIAKGKPAKSSSAWWLGPDVAADGNTDPDFNGKSCFSVDNGDRQPWWQVDLLDFYVIMEIRVTSRLDCCPERLRHFALEVYKEDPINHPDADQQLCYMYNGEVTQHGLTVNVTCTTPVTGRYLKLKGDTPRNDQDVLQFCEVQVMAIYWYVVLDLSLEEDISKTKSSPRNKTKM